MQSLKCNLSLVVVLVLCHMCMAMPGRYVRAADDASLVQLQFEDVERDLNPINSEDVPNDDLERIKRKIPDAKFEAKNAVLGFVFGFDHKRVKRAGGKGKSYPDDTPEFDRSNVSLDFPDELFNTSFATLTNVSKAISRLIMNSARRYARFILFFKPVFGNALMVQGFEDPTTTTTTTTTTASPNDSLNEI